MVPYLMRVVPRVAIMKRQRHPQTDLQGALRHLPRRDSTVLVVLHVVPHEYARAVLDDLHADQNTARDVCSVTQRTPDPEPLWVRSTTQPLTLVILSRPSRLRSRKTSTLRLGVSLQPVASLKHSQYSMSRRSGGGGGTSFGFVSFSSCWASILQAEVGVRSGRECLTSGYPGQAPIGPLPTLRKAAFRPRVQCTIWRD